MKLKYEQWRDAVVRHLFKHGPMILSQINEGLMNRDGLRWKAMPTTNQCAMVLRCDKRIMVREVKSKAGIASGPYKVYEYAVDKSVLREIGWVPW
jgi:hypothetical protein